MKIGLFSLVNFVVLFFRPYVVGSYCNHKPPCQLPPLEGYNASNVFDLLRKSFVYAPQNVTVYSGQTAVFTFQIDNPDDELTVLAYVDNCEKGDPVCKLVEGGTNLSRVCTFLDVQESDNGKEIQFYVFHLESLAKLCYEPSAHLHVLGFPPPVNINASVDVCDGVKITSSNIQKDTLLKYQLFSSDQELLYNMTNNDTTAVIPPKMLSNHTGEYLLKVIPTNPAGDGEPANLTLELSNMLRFRVNSLIIKTNVSHHFVTEIQIEINETCVLTVPNHFYVSSNCSSEGRVYPVDMEKLGDGMITILYPLLPSKRYCDFLVKDSSGKNYTTDTNQSTYNTHSFSVRTLNGSFIEAMCTFISTSSANGCLIVLYDEYGYFYNATMISLQYSSQYVKIGPLSSGNYSISVYDQVNGTHNASDVVFSVIVVIPFSHSAVQTPTVTTTTPTPTATRCSTGECIEGTASGLEIGLGVGIPMLAILILLIIAIIIIALISSRHKEDTGRRYEVQAQDEENISEDPVVKKVTDRDPYDMSPCIEQAVIPENIVHRDNGDDLQQCGKTEIKDATSQNKMPAETVHHRSKSDSQTSLNKHRHVSDPTDTKLTETMEMKDKQTPVQTSTQTETSVMDSTEPSFKSDHDNEPNKTNFALPELSNQKVIFSIPESSPLPSPGIGPPGGSIFIEPETHTTCTSSQQQEVVIRRPSQVTLTGADSSLCVPSVGSKPYPPKNDSKVTLKEEELIITPTSSLTTTQHPLRQETKDYPQNPSIDESETVLQKKEEVVQPTHSSNAHISTTRTDSSAQSESAPLIR